MLVQYIDQHIDITKKAVTSTRPLSTQIKTCEGYILRRLDRIKAIDKSLEALRAERLNVSKETALARKQLKELQRRQMAEADSLRPPTVSSAYSDLIRDLSALQDLAVQHIVLRHSGSIEEPVFYDLTESETEERQLDQDRMEEDEEEDKDD